MIGFLAIGAVVGIILGLRFKVLVLVPASLLSTGVVTAVGLLDGQQLKLIALTAVGVAALLQIGYVVGCVVEVAAPWRVAGKSGRMTSLPPTGHRAAATMISRDQNGQLSLEISVGCSARACQI